MIPVVIITVLLMLAPSAAQAFPMMEGTSSISALLGGLAALASSAAPRFRHSRWLRTLLLTIALLLLTCLTAFIALDLDRRAHIQEEEFVRQNRITERLDVEIVLPRPSLSLSEDELDWAGRYLSLVDIERFQEGEILEDAELVYISADESEKYQPARLRSFSQDEIGDLVDYAQSNDQPIVLVSESISDIVAAGQRLLSRGEGKIPAIWTRDLFSAHSEQWGDLPYYTNSDDIFFVNAIDIRPERVIALTHNTLANAQNIPAYDLLLMRDEDLRRALPKPAVFLSSDEVLYPIVDARLRSAGLQPGHDYQFYKHGLEWHFEDERHSVVPYHYNVRLVDPMKLHDVALLSDRLRFICTKPDQCQENIPSALRIDIPFSELGRDGARRAVEALDDHHLYTVISSGQETAVNALMAGWWLSLAGKNYLGEFILHERFSVGGYREKMVDIYGYGTKLEDWRTERHIEIAALSILAQATDRFGWIAVFGVLGLAVRLLLAPAQVAAARSAYLKPNAWISLASSVALLVSSLLAYLWLEDAISYFAVVPHATMQALMIGGWQWLDELLVILLVLHIWLTAPTKTTQTFLICGLVLLAWVNDVFDGIPDPLAVFLIGGETVAVIVLVGFAYMHACRERDARRGIFRSAMIGARANSLPEKWLLANQVAQQPGYLADLGIADTSRILREVTRLDAKTIIVRSASIDEREQGLGGYHHSEVVSTEGASLLEAVSRLRADGCSHAWIQPYIACDEGAVISSIGPDGRRATILLGPVHAATEGASGTRTITLKEIPQSLLKARLAKLLRKAERESGGPVLLEVGISGNNVHLFQVRRQDVRQAQEVALFPKGIDAFDLAEDFVARCSRLTGSIVGEVTKGDFVFIRGFLYRKRMSGILPRPFGRETYTKAERDALDLLDATQATEAAGLATRLEQLEQALKLYRRVYRMSQSPMRPRRVSSCLHGVMGRAVHELEVAGPRSAGMECLPEARMRCTREALHDVIVAITIVLNRIVSDLCHSEAAPDSLHIDDLRVSGTRAGPDLRDDVPLTHPEAGSVIVPGQMAGRPWPASSNEPPQDEGPYILVGEEISSHWVRHLARFKGIISVYGDANAHLGLSARALGIPYQKVAKSEMDALLAGEDGLRR